MIKLLETRSMRQEDRMLHTPQREALWKDIDATLSQLKGPKRKSPQKEHFLAFLLDKIHFLRRVRRPDLYPFLNRFERNSLPHSPIASLQRRTNTWEKIDETMQILRQIQ